MSPPESDPLAWSPTPSSPSPEYPAKTAEVASPVECCMAINGTGARGLLRPLWRASGPAATALLVESRGPSASAGSGGTGGGARTWEAPDRASSAPLGCVRPCSLLSLLVRSAGAGRLLLPGLPRTRAAAAAALARADARTSASMRANSSWGSPPGGGDNACDRGSVSGVAERGASARTSRSRSARAPSLKVPPLASPSPASSPARAELRGAGCRCCCCWCWAAPLLAAVPAAPSVLTGTVPGAAEDAPDAPANTGLSSCSDDGTAADGDAARPTGWGAEVGGDGGDGLPAEPREGASPLDDCTTVSGRPRAA